MPTYQPPRWQPPRKHGLQLPLSRDQLGAMIFYPALTLAFYLICGFYLPKEHLHWVLALYSACVVVSVACWCYVSLTDPAQAGGISCFCMKQTQSHSRYCASCRKSIPGLDHHCLWLNTCIGTRNYFFFFTLAVAGTLQFALQTAVSVLLLIHAGPSVQRAIKATVGDKRAYNAFMVIHAVCAAMALLSFASLCVFHTYLQGIGLGTYDWILSKRTPATATVAVPRPTTTTTTTTATAAAVPAAVAAPAAPSAAPPSSSAAVGGGGVNGGGPAKGGGGQQHVAVAIPPPASAPAQGAGTAAVGSHSIEMGRVVSRQGERGDPGPAATA